jgi:hypothetical protein
MATGGVGEAMLISAAVGGATSAATGGDPLKGAILGAAGGAAFGGLSGMAGGASGAGAGGAGAVGTAASGAPIVSASAPQIVNAAPATGSALTTAQAGLPTATGQVGTATLPSGAAEQVVMNPGIDRDISLLRQALPSPTQLEDSRDATKMFPKIAEFYAKNPIAAPAGIGAVAAALGDMDRGIDEEDKYRGPLSRFRYNPDTYRPITIASGGLMDTAAARHMAGGGHLGSYSDGGQLLKGREADSNGMNDDIPASIEGSQPALLADGEFVIPADVVSGLGNGSTEAGARQLYAMMEKVREARTGRSNQAPEIDAERMMPA